MRCPFFKGAALEGLFIISGPFYSSASNCTNIQAEFVLGAMTADLNDSCDPLLVVLTCIR